jgi:hypothetical protein
MESWKIIERVENHSVSDHGNVKNNKTARIMKQTITAEGYIRIGLRLKKVEHTKQIHILVATAFLPNPENKQCVDHIENCKTTNNISKFICKQKNASCSKGVHYNKAAQKWQASISIDGIRIDLGLFTNLEDAKQTRITRANKAFGVFTNSRERII